MGDLDFHAFKNMYSNNHLSKEFRFIHAPKDCANEYGAPVPGYALLRDNNSTAVVRGGGYDYSTITNWAIDHQLTNLVKWDIDMYEYVFAQTKKEVLILFTETEEQYDEKDVMLGEFSKLANSGLPITNEAVFAYSRNTSVAFNQTIKYM